MKVQEALIKGIKTLKEKNIEEASLKARILLASILSCNKEELIIKSEELFQEEEKYFKGIEKISIGYPVQYLTNNKEFMKMNFYVNENVLIPRNDTEILVEEVIKICKEGNKKEILEMCTGSGIISISLAKYLKNINITGVDVSEKALEIAKKNVKNLLEEENINFIQSDMFENIDKKFDVIVSNPPYIKTEVIKEYDLEYEPKIALDGGEDGLKFYRIIIEEGYKYLKENGIIALEIGYDQREDVMNIAKLSKKYNEINCIKDMAGNDRVVIIK